MTVVDIRNKVTDSRVKLIEISGSTVYYAEEKAEEGHYSLFLLEYDRNTQTERVVANCFLGDPAVVLHFYSFPGDIIAVRQTDRAGEKFGRAALCGQFCRLPGA